MAISLRETMYNNAVITLKALSTSIKIQKNMVPGKMKWLYWRFTHMNPITIAIAEDHKIFRKGIILSLRPYPHLHFVIEAGNGQELIDQLPGDALPEVILMDLRMPVVDGIAATQYITAHYPGIRIICLTMFEDRQFVDHMMKSGASAYLLKNAEPSEINQAIIKVMAEA
jgi:DNA-binding NarL/FixJ family response regulator